MGPDGEVTAIAPGGIDIFAEYAGFRTAATVIVYAPARRDPAARPPAGRATGPGLLVRPQPRSREAIGDAYDGALVRSIAADHGASLLAEWKNLVAFLLEYDIDTIEHLYDALLALDTDDRVVAYQLDYLYSPAQQPPERPLPPPDAAIRYSLYRASWRVVASPGEGPPVACTGTCRGSRQRLDPRSPGSGQTENNTG